MNDFAKSSSLVATTFFSNRESAIFCCSAFSYAALSSGNALGADASLERLASFIHLLASHGVLELRDRVADDSVTN